MSLPIDNLLGKEQGSDDYLVFTALSFNPETKSLEVRVDRICDPRWLIQTHLEEGKTYIFERHGNSDEAPYNSSDPMELWECLRPGQKANETILPQILLYFWHKDNRLSIELDW